MKNLIGEDISAIPFASAGDKKCRKGCYHAEGKRDDELISPQLLEEFYLPSDDYRLHRH
jgi:hypothetical protein